MNPCIRAQVLRFSALSLFALPSLAPLALAPLTALAKEPPPPAQAIATPQQQAPVPGRPLVQIAILLDTSNSMDGLIAQAKTELWRIVNEIASYQKDGVQPEVQVALYEYGKQSLPAGEQFLRRISGLTTDLDRISEALFALQTNGGDEFCGAVVDKAATDLEWSRSNSDYKAIFVAGNEPFDQGRIPWREAVAKARKRGIVVNTIHCGGISEGIQGRWRDAADAGGGSFISIDQDVAQVSIPTPYDAEIGALGEKLNDTYIGYGGQGKAMKQRQATQDSHAKSAGGSTAVERASVKGKAVYSNENWDLVDAKKKKNLDVKKMEAAELPDEMKAMSPEQRQVYVDGKAKEREEIQKKLADLDLKRRKFTEEQRKKDAVQDKGTFDAAMRKSVKAQMTEKAFAPK